MRKSIFLIFMILFISDIQALDQRAYDIPQLEKLAVKYKDDRIFYNLGILYNDEGKKGQAILNLRRANLLNPYNREIKNELNSLRDAIGIPSYLFDMSPLEQALLCPFLVLNINWTGFIGLLFLLAGSCGLSMILGRFTPKKLESWKNRIRTASVIFFAAGIIYIFSAVVRYISVFDVKNAVIMNDSALLERPESGSISINEVQPGMECVIKKISGDYYLIDTIDGHEGWIADTNLSRIWEGGL